MLREGVRLARKALDSKDHGALRDLRDFLNESSLSDPLAILVDKETRQRAFPARFESRQLDLDDWLRNINSWLYDYLAPRTKPQRENVLYTIWRHFQTTLAERLQQARRSSCIPPEGGLTAFVAGLTRCIVMDYSFHGALVQVEPVAVIKEPKSIFDIWTQVEQVADPSAKNALKRILSSGHKIVFHRGALVHVDRRHESSVFGPTIDTVLLAEVLVRTVADTAAGGRIERALEVGSGSGLITAVLLRNIPQLREHVAVDLDFSSVACTQKNCELLRPDFELPSMTYMGCRFTPDLLRRPFDLCLCNPPYVPTPPATAGSEARFLDNRRAAGGTELLVEVARKINEILSTDGRLVLVTSSLSLPLFRRALPPGFSIHFPLGKDGFRVPFDVDSVVTDTDWISYLTSKCGLESEGASFHHRLHPVVVARKREKRHA